ncbi:hypothetical protein AAGG49_22850, partial [Stenotrophomonas maltophilia]
DKINSPLAHDLQYRKLDNRGKDNIDERDDDLVVENQPEPGVDAVGRQRFDPAMAAIPAQTVLRPLQGTRPSA